MISVHLENGNVSIRDVRPPDRQQGFASIRLLVAGICNTDLELQRGYYGFAGTPGHEFVGEVIEASDDSLIGRRVVGEINLACHHCDWCSRGLERHCPERTVLGIVRYPGAFRGILTLPESNLHLVPDCISSEKAVFVEPLAAACEILDQLPIPAGAPVAVLGDGKLGLLIAQVLNIHGADVRLFGKHPAKLKIADDAGVAVETAAPRVFPTFDWVVEATGSAEGLRQAVAMTKPRGTIILKSTVHGLAAIDTAPIIVNELTLVGSRCGRFEPALRLLKDDNINLDAMISGVFPLAQAPAAFARAAERGVLKILMKPDL